MGNQKSCSRPRHHGGSAVMVKIRMLKEEKEMEKNKTTCTLVDGMKIENRVNGMLCPIITGQILVVKLNAK